jgi:hypothetical protein
MLVRFLGQDRITSGLAAVEELIERCARLPLALAIVAARAAGHPGVPLSGLAEELRNYAAGAAPGPRLRVTHAPNPPEPTEKRSQTPQTPP